MKRNLTFGSIVFLKNKKKLMIIDEFGKNNYNAILYPLGYKGEDTIISINKNDIEKVIYYGY